LGSKKKCPAWRVVIEKPQAISAASAGSMNTTA